MRLLSAGIDWQSANVEVRGSFGFDTQRVSELLHKLHTYDGVSGCVLLSTCNRCEVYFSTEPTAELNPANVLCEAAGLDAELYLQYFVTSQDENAVARLFEIACGLRSQILGEEQILTQLRDALSAARNTKTADAVLQTLFRLVITAGKEARTRVRLTGVPKSVAEKAVVIAEEKLGGLDGKRAVVIGNGEMGQLTATLLNQRGCNVTVTLRSYRHGETIVPEGCATIEYDSRAVALDGCDLLFSATTSPHFTVTTELLQSLTAPPRLIVDLAVPCDIEPGAGEKSGTILLNLDGITNGDVGEHNVGALRKTAEIIEKHQSEFYRWLHNRELYNRFGNRKGPQKMKLYIVSIGPGDTGMMTPRALDAIRESDAIAGYGVYLELIADLTDGKELIKSPMTQERERCIKARDLALGGKTVAIVSSGDAGVYGMAGLALELCRDYPKLEVEVIPGVTAATSAAAVLGAPLMHDFAVISLSDLLTPWETIEKRLRLSADADFVVCLYNPGSINRADHLSRACSLMLEYKSRDTMCGTVRNIGRGGEESAIMTLGELCNKSVDMFTTVIIGNSRTSVFGGRLVTPRGYENKVQA